MNCNVLQDVFLNTAVALAIRNQQRKKDTHPASASRFGFAIVLGVEEFPASSGAFNVEEVPMLFSESLSLSVA
jgi:hypothetical protein